MKDFWRAVWGYLKTAVKWLATKIAAPGVALLIIIGAIVLVALGFKEIQIGGIIGKLLGKDPPEDKKVIGFVVINSCINQNLSIQLKQLHYPLRVAKYSFLDHDSYVCCGELKEITINHFSERTCQSCGTIDKEDLEYITEAVITSPIET